MIGNGCDDDPASHCHACHFVLLTMDAPVDDEKKAFDAETAQDEDSQPDPEEHLMLDQGNGRIWLVKVRIKHCCRPPSSCSTKVAPN
jgi:hypothetical protein